MKEVFSGADYYPNLEAEESGGSVKEKYLDPAGEYAQGEHVGDPVVNKRKSFIVHGGAGVVDSHTAELMAVWQNEEIPGCGIRD